MPIVQGKLVDPSGTANVPGPNGNRLRLVKLIVQPVFVLDDGDTLNEQTGQPFVLSPGDIEGFPARWAADFAALQESFTPVVAP